MKKNKKKCCIGCAFCIYYKYKKRLLTEEERNKAIRNDFSFIGKEENTQNKWKNEYYKKINRLKRGEFNNIIGGVQALDLLQAESTASSNGESFYLKDTFGMGEMPEAPNEDYLACWHDFWNFKDNEKDLPTLNNENECLFFYPYTKKGNKSFEACEKERQESSAKERFKITNILVIAGLFATIISIAVSLFIYNASKKDNNAGMEMLNSTIKKQAEDYSEKLNEIKIITEENKKISEKIIKANKNKKVKPVYDN